MKTEKRDKQTHREYREDERKAGDTPRDIKMFP